MTLEATSLFVVVPSCPLDSTPSLFMSSDEVIENHGPCPGPSQNVVGERGLFKCMLQRNSCGDNTSGGETIMVGEQ